VSKSRNRELVELFQSGFGIHHAGMLRSDRNLTERLFSEGLIKVFSTLYCKLIWPLLSLPFGFFDTTSETFVTLEVQGQQHLKDMLRGWRKGYVSCMNSKIDRKLKPCAKLG